MKTILQRKWVLVPALLLLVPLSGQAKPVPLAELTQDLLRSRVSSYLAQDTTRQKLAPLDKLVRLDARQITYRADRGQPQELTWAYEPLVELNNVQRSLVEKSLDDVMTDVYGSYEGGLLSDADAVKVFQVARYVPAPGPRAPRQPAAQDRQGQKREGSGEQGGARVVGPAVTYTYVTQATACYYAAAPSYWGSPCCGWGYWAVPVVQYAQVPVLISPSSVPSMPQASIAPAALVQREATPPAVSEVRRKLLLKRRGPDDAPGLYARGVQAYNYGDYQEALDLLSAAVQLNSQDARYWYHKALSERALGQQTAAAESARRGAALELLGKPAPAQTMMALERVQGEARQFLRAARDATLTREVAMRLATEPVPGTPPTGVTSGKQGQGEGTQLTQQR